jgi:predicted nucleic acid-binding protein
MRIRSPSHPQTITHPVYAQKESTIAAPIWISDAWDRQSCLSKTGVFSIFAFCLLLCFMPSIGTERLGGTPNTRQGKRQSAKGKAQKAKLRPGSGVRWPEMSKPPSADLSLGDLIDVEVMSAIRRLAAGRRIDPHRSGQLLEELAALPAERYSHTPWIGRIWELRHSFTAYDATYIALAEAADSVLYTCDEKLRRGHRARVVLFTS